MKSRLLQIRIHTKIFGNVTISELMLKYYQDLLTNSRAERFERYSSSSPRLVLGAQGNLSRRSSFGTASFSISTFLQHKVSPLKPSKGKDALKKTP